jgi:DNA ligase-1
MGQDRGVLLAAVVSTSGQVTSTRSRSAKVATLAAVIRQADAAEVPAVVAFLSGELLQRRTGVGWAALRGLPTPAAAPSLTVGDVDQGFAAIAELSGAGSHTARRDLLMSLLARATADEQHFLARLVGGALRQGAAASLVVDAVAAAAEVPIDDLRRAVMLRGDVGPVAVAALEHGVAGLARFRLEVGRAVQPMLAKPAASVAAALEKLGTAAVEWKFDGVRVQAHKQGDRIAVFSRTLDDLTARVPELVELVATLPADRVVLDGEALVLRPDGRPQPFQVTGSRVGSTADVAAARASAPLTPYFFDVLHLDGADLLAAPGAERTAALDAVVPAAMRAPRLVTSDPLSAQRFFDAAVAAGHEGVVVKSLDVPYAAGRRGAGWIKVKPVHTLDLVVLAAEWGHGRRRGWLSNLHLGAHDPDTGGFIMLGKTFKGLTDEMLRWQTDRLLELAVDRGAWQVVVRPELVVEVAFDGVQTSRRDPGGVALRFARVVRHRPDKSAAEADTLAAVLATAARE